jgi:alpha-ketoglutarate-dependent 2,4-dichlorophenoxyacetate dioxygenase
MTVAKNEVAFSHISVKELHPNFAAEISGVEFSSALSDEVFREISQAVTKASSLSTFPLSRN